MNELITRTFKSNPVRITDRNGEPWFIAKDVADILGIKNVRKSLSNFPPSERMTVTSSYGHSGQRGGAQSINIVNEPGLYRLIFKSRKPEAEEFKTWVFTEVLPSIRKTGAYVEQGAQLNNEMLLSLKQFIHEEIQAAFKQQIFELPSPEVVPFVPIVKDTSEDDMLVLFIKRCIEISNNKKDYIPAKQLWAIYERFVKKSCMTKAKIKQKQFKNRFFDLCPDARPGVKQGSQVYQHITWKQNTQNLIAGPS